MTVDDPAEPRPDPPVGARHPRRRRRRRCSPAPRRLLVDLARLILVGRGRRRRPRVHRARPPSTPRCASSSAARSRMFQAVKHHCANMLVATELATARRVGRARAADDRRRPAHLHRRGRRHARRRRPPTCAPTSTSRCTAASASRGSTTPTSTCAGPPRSLALLDADEAARRRHRPHPRRA